jgi:pilus assembly protein CpaB
MPLRSLIVLGLGIVIALGTAVSLSKRMNKQSQSTAEMSQVLVATTNIAAGTFVRSDAQLAMVDWPKGNITASMLTRATTKTSDYNGAVARRSISKGEAIAANMLVKSNEGGFMSAVLEPGKRAVSIPVDSTTGNAGFIFPGDRVDLILTHAVTKQSIETRASETFVEDVRVLAVDQMLDNPENKAVLAKTVTLEVSPKQAEEINLAKDLGKISLSLRSLASGQDVPKVLRASEGDIPNTASEPDSLDDLLRTQETEGAHGSTVTRDTEVSRIISPAEGASSPVVVIRGNERMTVQFGPQEEVSGGQ